MYAVLTPDLFTIVNNDGEEFNLPVYPREYQLIASEGYNVKTTLHYDPRYTILDCYDSIEFRGITIEQFIFNIRSTIFFASGDRIIPDWLASVMGMTVLSVFDNDENVHDAQLPINLGIVYKKR